MLPPFLRGGFLSAVISGGGPDYKAVRVKLEASLSNLLVCRCVGYAASGGAALLREPDKQASRQAHTHTNTRTHARTHARTDARTHGRTHTHTNNKTHTHAHTH